MTTFKLEDVGAEKEVRTTVTVLEQPHPSPEGGAKTSIRFINRTTGPIKLFTLDAGGERTEMGTVEADQEKEQTTATGHVWIVTDRNDRPLGMFEATEKPGVAVVENAATAARVRSWRRRISRRSRRRDWPEPNRPMGSGGLKSKKTTSSCET